MPSHVLDGNIFERCCVQLSMPLAPDHPSSEALAFLAQYIPLHPVECATAVVMRVAWSAPRDDRLGAWLLLDAAIRSCMTDNKAVASSSRNSSTNRTLLTNGTHPLGTNGHINGGDDDVITQQQQHQLSPRQTFGTIVGQYLVPVIKSAWDEDFAPPAYTAIRTGWSNTFNSVMFLQVKNAMHARRKNTTNAIHESLKIPDSIIDALWKLRRESPRPSTSLYLAKVFDVDEAHGRSMATAGSTQSTFGITSTKIISWIAQYYTGECCLRCDSWNHSDATCPATASHVAQLKPLSHSQALSVLQAYVPKALATENIGSPETAGYVIDAVYDRMVRQEPFETILGAFDTLRRVVTSPQSRAALSIIASYHLQPSKVSLHVPLRDVDAAVSPVMQRVRTHLVDRERRIREYLQLEHSARVVAAEFRGALPDAVKKILTSSTIDFIFVPLGLTHWDPFKPPQRRRSAEESSAPCESEVIATKALSQLTTAATLAPHRDIVALLCRRCLDPTHRSLECCPKKTTQPHDLSVAQSILGIVWSGKDNTKASVLNKVIEYARDVEDSLKSSAGGCAGVPESTLRHFAAALALKCDDQRDGVVPFCGKCSVLGHDREDCPVVVGMLLHQLGLNEYVLRAFPKAADGALARLRESVRKAQEELGQIEENVQSSEEYLRRTKRDKNDLHTLEAALRALGRREPRFSRDHYSRLESLNDFIFRNRAYFRFGVAAVVFFPTAAEKLLQSLHGTASILHVLQDPGLPMDDVMLAALHMASSMGHLPLPTMDRILDLQQQLQQHCLRLCDVFCEEMKRSPTADTMLRGVESGYSTLPVTSVVVIREIHNGLRIVKSALDEAIRNADLETATSSGLLDSSGERLTNTAVADPLVIGLKRNRDAYEEGAAVPARHGSH